MISKNIVTIKDLAQVKRFSALGGPPSLRRSCRWQDWRSLWSIIARPNSSWPDHYAAPQALSLAVPDAEKVLQFLFNVNQHTLFFWIIFCNTFWAQWLGQSWSQFLRKCTCFLKKKLFPAAVNTSSPYLDDIKGSGGFGRDCAFSMSCPELTMLAGWPWQQHQKPKTQVKPAMCYAPNHMFSHLTSHKTKLKQLLGLFSENLEVRREETQIAFESAQMQTADYRLNQQ